MTSVRLLIERKKSLNFSRLAKQSVERYVVITGNEILSARLTIIVCLLYEIGFNSQIKH